jgi:pimeloyl-ACP methyl ester carboxylesterase
VGYRTVGATGRDAAARRIDDGPYDQRLVRYANAGETLEATVFLPRPQATNIGVVMIHGSGTSHRNNLWYVVQADYLARRGITVLLPDKRGSGRSGGAWTTSSLEMLADDAIAAVDALASLEGSAARRIGLLGLSLGGRVAGIAAGSRPDLAFAVSVVSGLTTLDEALAFQLRNDWSRRLKLPRILVGPIAAFDTFLVRDRRRAYWRTNGNVDPTPFWRSTTAPALMIFGRLDETDNVPVERSVSILREINRGRPRPIDIRVYEDMGHGLFDPQTDWVSERYLGDLTGWILEHAEPETAPPSGPGG